MPHVWTAEATLVAELQPDLPLKASSLRKLLDNLLAFTEGASGAPPLGADQLPAMAADTTLANNFVEEQSVSSLSFSASAEVAARSFIVKRAGDCWLRFQAMGGLVTQGGEAVPYQSVTCKVYINGALVSTLSAFQVVSNQAMTPALYTGSGAHRLTGLVVGDEIGFRVVASTFDPIVLVLRSEILTSNPLMNRAWPKA